MKNKKTTQKISTITLVIILTISTMLVIFPNAIAQDPPRKKTYAIMGATPNPIGVNQQVLLHIGITHQLSSAQYGWEDITVTITKPDTSTQTLGPYKTDATGGTGGIFTPTMVGTYQLQSHFPEQVMPARVSWAGVVTEAGTIMEASDSSILELVVTTEPREFYPGNSLPNEYWTRPIDAQLREWSTISGNFLEGADRTGMWVVPFNDDVTESAHILWAKQMQMGGLAGGTTGNHAFEDGDAYEGLFDGSVIIGGNLYYNHYKSGYPTQEVVAVNLHTGEELWSKTLLDPDGNAIRLSFGQTFYWDSYNYHAVFPFLWGTRGSTWHAFDPFDGNLVYSMANVPSGSTIYGPKGEIYRVSVSTGSATVRLWNSSRVVSDAGSFLGGFQGAGYRVYNATEGIEWTINIPEGLPGGANVIEFGGNVIAIGGRQRGFLYQSEGSQDKIVGISVTPTQVRSWGVSLAPGNEGALLFNSSQSAPAVWTEDVQLSEGIVSLEDGVFTVWVPELRQHWGFNLETAQTIWGPTEPQYYLDYLAGLAIRNALYEGMLISAQMSGTVYAYDVVTGDLEWSYDAVDPYTEILWADNWPLRVNFFADGKIYLTHSEHSPIDPKPRGSAFICLDAETGDEVWRIDGAFRGNDWGGNAIVGDSIIATMDSYDQRVYAIGKGPSKITVEAPLVSVPQGSTVTLRGMVTDISPGTMDDALTSRFPNGVPVVSDADMSEWMLYLYKHLARPANAMGVEVKLETYDPNGNFYEIGRATSDQTGFYTLTWEPLVPGSYLIFASFEGSESYYPSAVETSISVDPADPEVVIPPYPADPGYQGPSASEVAQNVVNSLPDDPTAAEIAQAVENQLNIQEATEIPEYTTIDLVILVAVAVAIVISLVSLLTILRKRQ